MTWAWRIVEVLSVVPVAAGLAAALLFIGVIGLTLWAGWSRNRYLARIGWKGVSQWK